MTSSTGNEAQNNDLALNQIRVNVIGADWELISPDSSPNRRVDQSWVYDSMRSELLMIGGRDGPQHTDTWKYDASTDTWTQKTTSNQPELAAHAAVYDSQNDKIIVFGGFEGSQWSDTTWQMDPANGQWTEISTAISPTGRWNPEMVYDEANDKIILFGGSRLVDEVFGDTWEFDLTSQTWTQLNPTTSPQARVSHAMVYNSDTETIFLYGGWNTSHNLVDTWEYDGTEGSWSLVNQDSGLPRSAFNMIYDNSNKKIVTWGGFGPLRNATQVFDTTTKAWSILPHDIAPAPRNAENILGYDPVDVTIVMFGGYIETYQSETWELKLSDKGVWSQTPIVPQDTMEEESEDDDQGILNSTNLTYVSLVIVLSANLMRLKRRKGI